MGDQVKLIAHRCALRVRTWRFRLWDIETRVGCMDDRLAVAGPRTVGRVPLIRNVLRV